MNPEDEPLAALRNSWRDLDPSGDSDARTFLVVTKLRDAWQHQPIPAPRYRVPRRFASWRAAIAAALLAVATLALSQHEISNPGRIPPARARAGELAIELARLTTWSGTTALLLPCFVCLGCEALLASPDSAVVLPPNERDQRLSDALRADCRGDWSGAVAILEPLLDDPQLTSDQHTRAKVALARAYQQLGHSDRALALADVALARPH